MSQEGLGADNTISKAAFIEAMREQVFADTLAANAGDPQATDKAQQAAANLDLPEVQKNFAPLAEAVYRIVATHAKTTSDPDIDAQFWQWMADVNEWLAALSDWQQGMAQAFANWTAGPADVALKTAITGLPSPGSPPSPVPKTLTGRIE